MFSHKSAYHLWSHFSQQSWKRDDDPFLSAHKLLAEYSTPNETPYTFEEIVLEEEDGFLALAFAIPNILQKWSSCI